MTATTAQSRDVILFAPADWSSPYWTNSQHMAVSFAECGYRVLYVETVGIRRPRFERADIGRALRRLHSGLAPIREMRKNIWVLSPLAIPAGHRSASIKRINAALLTFRLGAWSGKTRPPPLVWTYHPFMGSVIDAIVPSTLVYHCADDIGAIPGVDRLAFDAAERSLLARADHVFVTSPALGDRCRPFAQARTHYFPNVADIGHFGQARTAHEIPADLAAIPQPRLGYVGVLSDFKVDCALLAAVAKARPHWHIVLIGGSRDGQAGGAFAALQSLANVHCLGWRPYARLPDYLRGIDVALLPQQSNDYTRAMFPMKFFEYLAAGRPVIATKLPALAEFSALYRIAETPPAFIAEIETALARPDALRIPLDHDILRKHSWGARTQAMLAIVNGIGGRSTTARRPAQADR